MASVRNFMNTPKVTSFKFVVGNFSSKKDELVSPDYKIPGVDFAIELVLYPEIKTFRRFPSTSLIYVGFGNNHANMPNQLLQCQISILNKDGEKCHTKDGLLVIKDEKIESDWFYSISRNTLMDSANGLLLNDNLTINLEVYVPEQPNSTKALAIAQMEHNSILSDLHSLLESKKCSDVVLISGESEFSAHKCILSIRSPVLAAMFEHDCEEKNQNRVEITDVDAAVLGELLRYIYTGSVSSMEHYSADLLVAADKYQMDSLKSICEQSLSLGLDIESAMKLFLLSDMHGATVLKVNCLNYIKNHSAEINSEQWKAVTSVRPELGFELFNALATRK